MKALKPVFIFLVFFIPVIKGISQSINWFSSTRLDTGIITYIKDIKASPLTESTYSCGSFYSVTIMSGFPFASGSINGYLMKVNDKGDTLWSIRSSTTATAAGSAFYPSAMTIDKNENVYIIGQYSFSAPGFQYFMSGITFNPYQGSFIMKYDSSGRLIRATQLNINYCNFDDVDVDMYGNLYIMGNTRLMQVFGTDTIKKPTVAAGTNYSRDFILSYDSSGNVRWARSLGEIDLNAAQFTTDRGGLMSLVVDKTPQRNVYVCGEYYDTYSYQGQTLTSAGHEDAMLIKFDSLGKHLKTIAINGSSGRDVLLSIDINDYDAIVIGGYFTISTTINGTTYSSGSSNVSFCQSFMAKLDTALNYKWVYLSPLLTASSIVAIDNDERCAYSRMNQVNSGGTAYISYLDFLDSTGKVLFTKNGNFPVGNGFNNVYPTTVAFSKINKDRLYWGGNYRTSKLMLDSTIKVSCHDSLHGEALILNILIPDGDSCRHKVELGSDTTYCSNFSRILDVGLANAKYQWWYNGTPVDTLKTITAKLPGMYKVNVTAAFCPKSNYTDSIYIDQKTAPPAVNLGPDSLACNKDSVILYSTNLTDKRMWNGKTIDSAVKYKVTKTGTYWLKTYNICGASADTIKVEINATPSFSLGNDTTYCKVFTTRLKAVPTGNSHKFLWSTADTGSFVITSAPGTYWCRATNNCGTVADTIQILQKTKPTVNLGADVQACDVPSVLLNANTMQDKIEWNSLPADTLPTYLVTKTGNNWVKVYNFCGVAYDTVNITFGASPAVQLGNDTTVCNTTQYILNAQNTGNTIRWNGNTNDSGQYYTASKSGLYYVLVTNNCGVAADSIQVEFKATPVVNLGRDTSICPGSTFQLDARNPGCSYIWQSGSSPGNQTYTVTKGGMYWVKVGNVCGNAYDTLNVGQLSLPVVNLGPDVAVKLPFSKTLDAGNVGSRYKWSTLPSDTLQTLTVNATGWYWVDVTNSCGTVRDSVHISLNTTGINETTRQSLVIFPNPATESDFYVRFSNEAANPVFELTDVTGRQISYTAEAVGTGIYKLTALQPLAPGIYYLQATTGGHMFSQKIVVK